MNNLPLRYLIAITFGLITISATGCAPAYQKVDVDLLEQNRSKTFKLGFVKAAGEQSDFRLMDTRWLSSDSVKLIADSTIEATNEIIKNASGLSLLYKQWDSSSPYFGYIAKAVDKIPAAEICALLSSKYSITIDANVDKTVRVGEERIVRQVYVQTGRPQDNKWEFRDETSTILYAQYGNPNSTKELPHVVNVTYSVVYTPGLLFYYDIDIISSGQKVVTLQGHVKEGYPGKSTLDSYVDYAGRISEVLKKHLADDSYEFLSKTVATTNTFLLQDHSDGLGVP
jgi:hypothetical protein